MAISMIPGVDQATYDRLREIGCSHRFLKTIINDPLYTFDFYSKRVSAGRNLAVVPAEHQPEVLAFMAIHAGQALAKG